MILALLDHIVNEYVDLICPHIASNLTRETSQIYEDDSIHWNKIKSFSNFIPSLSNQAYDS